MTDPFVSQAPDPYRVRPTGSAVGTQLGDILARTRMETEPYRPPAWSQRLTVPSMTAPRATSSSGPRRSTDFPFRFQAPNIFGEGAPQQQQPTGFEQLLSSEIGQTAMTGLGAMPGERELFHGGVATMPITLANFPTYGREGFLSALSYFFLDKGYQQTGTGVFGEDVEYSGPEDLNLGQQVLKGVIDGAKAAGDVVWGAFDGVAQWNREATAQDKAMRVRNLFATGRSGRPYIPLEAGFIDNMLSSVGLGKPSARYDLGELAAAAQAQGGLDLTELAASYWDLPVEVVAAIQRDPDMSDEQMHELVEGVPLSQDALTNLIAEGGFMIGEIVAVAALTGGVGALAGGVRTGAGLGRSAYGVTVRGGKLAEGASLSARATGRAGYLTRKALQLNAVNTAAGWTTRGLEWGLKQYGGIVGDEGLVRLADEMLWEMPWSMNPGLNLIDGFTTHPLRHWNQLRGKGGTSKRIVFGDEGSFSEAGAINLSREGERLGGWVDPPRSPYRTAEGLLDTAGMTATRTAADDIRVTIAGKEVVIGKDKPMAVLVDRIDALQTVDDVMPLLRGLDWERSWLVEAFESGKYGLDMNDLRNFLIYGYAQVVRDRGFSPLTLPGATLRERSRSFFRIEAPEIIDSLFSDLQGKSGHLAQSMKKQWWELGALNDSHMAQLKGHLSEAYDPRVSFESARHWIGASKRLHEAYKANAAVGDMVLTYSRRLNPRYIRDMRDHVMLHYERGQKVTRTDINLFRRGAGPVEQIEPALRNGKKRWTREQFIRLLDKLSERADDGAQPPKRKLDPNLPEGWEPGVDFAADARVLGIEPTHARAIEAAMRLDETPASMPPRGVIEAVSKDLAVNADTLAADPVAAWERIFDWYRTRLDEMGDSIITRDSVARLRGIVDADAAAGRVEPALAARVAEAADRIGSELVNKPIKRPLGVKGAPPDGVVWASDEGMKRWTQATLRARSLSNEITTFADDPLNRLRLVGQPTDDVRHVGEFVVRMGDEGRLRDLEALVEFYRTHPAEVLMDDASRALVNDPLTHPFAKINALAGATWPPSMSAELRGIATTLRNVDTDKMLREIVAEVDTIPPEANVLDALNDLTVRTAGHMQKRDDLIDELLAVDRSYDTVEGVLTQETRLVFDRRRGASVEPSRPIVSREAAQSEATRTNAEARLTRAERDLGTARAEEERLAAQVADADTRAPEPFTPPEEPAAVARAADEAPEAPPAVEPAPQPAKRLDTERTRKAEEAVEPGTAPTAELGTKTLAEFDAYLKSKPGLRTSEPGLRADYRTVKAKKAKKAVPYVRDLAREQEYDAGRAMLAKMLDDGRVDQTDHDALLKILTRDEPVPEGPDAVGTHPAFAELPEAEFAGDMMPAPREGPIVGKAVKGDDPVRGTKLGTGTVESQLRLREADDLIDSWDESFPRERLQPRDTATQESEQLVREIAADPLPERLLRAESDMTEGAPVTSVEGWVEVGNHRSRGLKQAYEEGNAEGYKQALIERANDFGFDPDVVRRMKRPVLVREVGEEYVNAAYARAWNQGTGMSATSEAGSIGRNLDLAAMADLTSKGTLDDVLAGAGGADIIKRIMGEGGEAFAKKYIENGVLNAEGQLLVKTAIVARVVGDEKVARAIVSTVGTERGAAPMLARAIVRQGGPLMELVQKVGADGDLALGDLLARGHYLLREAEGVERGSTRGIKGGTQTTFGAADEAGKGAQAAAYLRSSVEQGNATPEEAGFASVILELQNTDEVSGFLRAYTDPVVASADRAGTAQMFGEDILGAGATRTQRLNLAVKEVNEARMAKAVEKATKEQREGSGLFGSSAEQVEVKEVAPIPADDGVARSSFETPEGTAATSADVPVLESVDEAIAARTSTAERVIVHAAEGVADIPPGKPVVIRSTRYIEAKALKAGKELEPGELRASVERRIAEFENNAGTRRERLMANYYELQNAPAEFADPANLIMLRAFSISEKWKAAPPQADQWVGKVAPKAQDARNAAKALKMADDYEAALRRAEAVAGPDDIVNISGDDAAIVGQSGRVSRPEFTARTGVEASEEQLVNEVKELADTGAEVIARGDDDVARGAAQTHGNLPRTPERQKLVILNEKELEQQRASLQNQLERAKGRRAAAESEADAAREAAPDGHRPGQNELELPEQAWTLWQRYVWDPLGHATGIDRPQYIGEVEDVLRSLDYGFPSADNAMTVSEMEQLRLMLREFLDAKYDEWQLPRTPMRVRPKRVGTRLDGEARGSTPTEHHYMLEELAEELATKVYKTDEPLEGYLGVGYEFIPPPTKGLDGRPLSTRLFWEPKLSAELRAYEEAMPGLGRELATARMASWPKRVDDVLSHEAATNLATDNGFTRAAASLYDTLFGARRQQTIHEQAISRFADDLLELTPEERARIVVDPDLMKMLEQEQRVILGLVRKWHERMAQETVPLVKMRTYRRVGLLGPERLERWTLEYLADAGDAGERILQRIRQRQEAGVQTPVWDAWRRADNRIRAYFSERNGGTASWVDKVYESRPVRWGSDKLSGMTVIYHTARFLLDARWLAMEFLEAPTLLLSREGPQALWEAVQLTRGKRSPELLFASQESFESAMSKWAWWAAQTDAMGTGGRYMRFRENAVFSQVERSQQRGFVKAIMDLAVSDERMARIMRDFGDTPADYLRRLDRDWRLLTTQQRRNIPEAEMREILQPFLDEGTIVAAEVDDMVTAGTWTVHEGLQQAVAHADDPVTRLLLRRLEVMTAQSIDDASQLIFGQVDRSNVQRFMNSPLLYWPISYQIKATKWLGGLMLDRFMGVDTGAGGAVTMGMLWEANKQALQSDPEYHRFLRENKEALFFLSMLLPITPWDIGVSLSPWTRTSISMATEGEAHDYTRNIFSVGPFYSYLQLGPRLLRERAQYDEGFFGDVAERAQRMFPVSTNMPIHERQDMGPAP